MQTIIVGDVHGCIEELETLLRVCGHQSSDHVVFVGDLVAKGPDSHAVVSLARRLGALAVRGNHDKRVIDWKAAVDRGEPPAVLAPHHVQVCETLAVEDWTYLAAMPYWLRLPEHGGIVVHGGLAPSVSLEDQNPDVVVRMRSVRPDGSPSARVEGGVPWASQWPGPEHVWFGHDAVRGLQLYPFATGLDTGCVYGHELTAMVLPGRKLVSVPAQRVWSPPESEP